MFSQTASSRKRSPWVESINSGRNGAAYFLALENVLQAKPLDYYESRGMDLTNQKAVMQEWDGWMSTFRGSEYKVLVDLSRMSHNQAKAATEYLIKKELVGRKLDMLATSREQLRDNEVEMTHMLKTVPLPVEILDKKKRKRLNMEEVSTSKTNKTTRMFDLSSRKVDDVNTALPSTPQNRSPSPTLIRTESPESPPKMYTAGAKKDPFQAREDDDEDNEEDGSSADALEENEVLLPDNTDHVFRFSAVLEGIDVAIGFQSFFTAVKKKTVYIHDIDQALARSGVILLGKEGTELQNLHFGEKTLVQMREKALAKWLDTEATAGRNQVRAWLDSHEDHGYDREKSRKHISENAPSDKKYHKLWAYLVTAIEEFPQTDSCKSYSESTAISSFILPLCRVFMSMPDKRVILNFVDSMTASGRSRNGSRSRKEPDLALEIKDRTNKTICEVGIGEVTSHAQKGLKKKNAKDLVRVGLSLKDALDFIQEEYGVNDAVLVGWQVIGQIMAIYLMFKCGNLYIMVHVRDVFIPDNLMELGMISTQIKVWNDLRATVEQGLSPVFEAMASGKSRVISTIGSVYARIETTRTPEFKTFLSRG